MSIQNKWQQYSRYYRDKHIKHTTKLQVTMQTWTVFFKEKESRKKKERRKMNKKRTTEIGRQRQKRKARKKRGGEH